MSPHYRVDVLFIFDSSPAPVQLRTIARHRQEEAAEHAVEPSEVAELFKKHRRKLVALLRRLLRSSPAAVDDALQDCFVRVLSSQEQAPAHPEGFLFSHAWRAGLDLLRRTRKRNSLEIPQSAAPPDELQDTPDHRTPDLDLEKQQLVRVINRALSELPEPCQRAYLYVKSGQLSVAEVAAVLGVVDGSVRRYVRRAEEHLKNAVDHYEKGAHK